jgi:hypothetical protein
MIGSIVEGINMALAPTGAMLFGIATPMSSEDQDGKQSIIPSVIDKHGECKYPDPEDTNALTIYHRINSKQYIKSKGFGDGNGLNVIHEMKLVCFGNRKKVIVTVDEVEHSLVALIPEKVNGQKVDVTLSDFDQNKIFNEEYQGVENFITPDMFLFAIRYKVTVPFNSTKCLQNLLIKTD